MVFDLAPPLEMFDCGLKAFSMLKLKISVNHGPSTPSGAEGERKNPIAGNEIMFTLNLKPPLIILIAFWEKIRFFPNERWEIASHFSLSGRPPPFPAGFMQMIQFNVDLNEFNQSEISPRCQSCAQE